MAFLPMTKSGGGISPEVVYKSSYNTNMNNVGVTVEVGKTYVLNFITTTYNSYYFSGGDTIIWTTGNRADYGNNVRLWVCVFVATSNTIKVTGAQSWDWVLTKLD